MRCLRTHAASRRGYWKKGLKEIIVTLPLVIKYLSLSAEKKITIIRLMVMPLFLSVRPHSAPYGCVSACIRYPLHAYASVLSAASVSKARIAAANKGKKTTLLLKRRNAHSNLQIILIS